MKDFDPSYQEIQTASISRICRRLAAEKGWSVEQIKEMLLDGLQQSQQPPGRIENDFEMLSGLAKKHRTVVPKKKVLA